MDALGKGIQKNYKVSEDTCLEHWQHPPHLSKRNWFDGPVSCIMLSVEKVQDEVLGWCSEKPNSHRGWLLTRQKGNHTDIKLRHHQLLHEAWVGQWNSIALLSLHFTVIHAK